MKDRCHVDRGVVQRSARSGSSGGCVVFHVFRDGLTMSDIREFYWEARMASIGHSVEFQAQEGIYSSTTCSTRMKQSLNGDVIQNLRCAEPEPFVYCDSRFCWHRDRLSVR